MTPDPRCTPGSQSVIRIYLDFNLLIYAQEGSLGTNSDEDVQWAYSDEHFHEIRRGNEESASRILGTLKELGARKLTIAKDTEHRFLDRATLLDYRDPANL